MQEKLKLKLKMGTITALTLGVIGGTIFIDKEVKEIERLVENTVVANKKSTYFRLDVSKTGSGKYYNELTSAPRPRGPDSTRTCFYNLDENPDTIEQYIKYIPSPNPRRWMVVENLVSKGFKPCNKAGPNSDIKEMTLDKQIIINQEFQKESQYFETDPIIIKKEEYRK